MLWSAAAEKGKETCYGECDGVLLQEGGGVGQAEDLLPAVLSQLATGVLLCKYYYG